MGAFESSFLSIIIIRLNLIKNLLCAEKDCKQPFQKSLIHCFYVIL